MSPLKPLHHCSKQSCPRLTHDRFCSKHTKQENEKYEKERGSASERGYNSTWARVRIMKLSNSPLCERCHVKRVIESANLVHHRDRNPRNNEEDNLESLCDGCHDIEHKQERWGGRSLSYQTDPEKP